VLYNRGYDNNEYFAGAGVVVVVVVWNFCFGVLLAIPWCVLLWHTSGLVGLCLLPVLSNFRQNWCVVMCLFSLWLRSVRGASFVEWLFDTVLLVRMIVRTGF